MVVKEEMESFKKVLENGTVEYRNNDGLLHREDGPAIEWTNGTIFWYLNGERHREAGPAIEFAKGDKEWWINGHLHREDGPAIEYANGEDEWFSQGYELSDTEILKIRNKFFKNSKTVKLNFQ